MKENLLNTVEVKVSEGDKTHNVTFHASKGLGFPFGSELDTEVSEKVHQAHIQILSFESELMKWMAQSDENAALFLKKPLEALEKANLGIPKEVMENIQNASNLLINNLKK